MTETEHHQVPDPPDDVRGLLTDCIGGFHEAAGIDDSMSDDPADEARWVLDTLAAAGAVVVFGDGLPMGARLERLQHETWDPHIEEIVHSPGRRGAQPLWRVLTDKEPTDD